MNIFAVREEIEPEIEVPNMDAVSPAVIKVIGAGGGGSNAINRMIESGLSGVEFIAVNTDVQDLAKSKAGIKLQIGAKLTGGKGAGGKPEKGEAAAKEDQEKISDYLRGGDMTLIAAGMGGGTGTGSAPIIAKISREYGALTVAVVTKPFLREGPLKMKLAEDGIEKLRKEVDALIIIPNQNLFKKVDRKTPATHAYKIADEVLMDGVQGISDLITKQGVINVDFADVESILKGQGDALMGIGIGTGDNRAKDAIVNAIDNPLLEDTGIEGATKILVNITGPEDVSLVEIDEIMGVIQEKADQDVFMIHGYSIDPALGDSIKVTVLATGFQAKPAEGVHKTEPFRKMESVHPGDVVTYNDFNWMRGGQADKKEPIYGYGGGSGVREQQSHLEVPTFLRTSDFGQETGGNGKAVSGGRDK